MGYIAEECLIGTILVSGGEEVGNVCDMIQPEMFVMELAGRIYLEALRAYDNHRQVNVEVIVQAIAGDTFPESVVRQEILDCVNACDPILANSKEYAKVIRNEYKARQFDRILSEIRPNAGDIDNQIGIVITKLEGLIEAKGSETKTIAEIAKENKNKYFREDAAKKLTIGFLELDDILGGLEGGDVTIIGARPGVGKSALVTQIAAHMAKEGHKVGFYNLEMREKQIYERFVVAKSGIGLTRLRKSKSLPVMEKEKFDRANEELEKQTNLFITTGSKLVSEIRNESRHMGYDVIIIDYLQLLRTDSQYRGNRYAEVGAISKAIKGMAMEFNIPIIVLSQLNRLSESKDIKEPTMAELRESGDIEQDASNVILLWNKNPNDRSLKGCNVEKQRQGKTGKYELIFNGDLMRFEEKQQWIDVSNQEELPFT